MSLTTWSVSFQVSVAWLVTESPAAATSVTWVVYGDRDRAAGVGIDVTDEPCEHGGIAAVRIQRLDVARDQGGTRGQAGGGVEHLAAAGHGNRSETVEFEPGRQVVEDGRVVRCGSGRNRDRDFVVDRLADRRRGPVVRRVPGIERLDVLHDVGQRHDDEVGVAVGVGAGVTLVRVVGRQHVLIEAVRREVCGVHQVRSGDGWIIDLGLIGETGGAVRVRWRRGPTSPSGST